MAFAVIEAKEGSVAGKYEYDVFCSFSNRDGTAFFDSIIRYPLVKHVSRVIRYDNPEVGKENTYIGRSKMALIFLTMDYISSIWCLNQLVNILKSKTIYGQQLIPIYCDLDPSEVEKRTFASFTGVKRRDRNQALREVIKFPGYTLPKQEDFFTDLKRRDRNQALREVIKFPGYTLPKQEDFFTERDWNQALREVIKFPGYTLPKQEDLSYSSNLSRTIEEIRDKLMTHGSKVLAGTIKGFMHRAAEFKKIEAVLGLEVGLLNQEGEGSSSQETDENPVFLHSVKSCLQSISDLTEIPLSDLEGMYAARVLDLSNKSIESLPKEIYSLVQLVKLLLRDDELLMELPSEIGALQNLKVLDVEGTDLICLPKEIGNLHRLECLKVSLYRCADRYIKKGIQEIIPRGALSNLYRLKELSIDVDPDCDWWDAEVEAIINELPKLGDLKILKLFIPTDKLLQKFLQLPRNVYTSLSNFRLIVGRHEPDIVFVLPNDLQNEFEKSEKCLKYVNGKGNTDGIGKALEHAKALFLDRHWTIKRLSEFKICEMHLLVCCLVVECNEMKTVIDGNDFYQGDNDSDKKPLKSLRYLSVHHMKNLQCIWKGPTIAGCLYNLQILVLYTCPELITVFNPALLRNLINLKELIVKNCPKIKSLVSVEPDFLQSDREFLPRLQKVLLVHLPQLLSISSGLIIGWKLQIVVYNCPKLENLSPHIECMHEIKDESQWSMALDSTSNDTEYLRHIFVNFMDQLKDSENAPSFETQAARTEDLVLNKDVLKEDKIEQGVLNKDVLKEDKIEQGFAPFQYGLDMLANDASIVSICGVAGIGKTTIAKSVYNWNYDKFEGSCFLSNIRQYSKKPNGLVRLQEKLLSSILPKRKEERNIYDVYYGSLRIQNAVRNIRVLIVLDDVDDLSQLQALLGKRDWYCHGSKIIITTRQTELLTGYQVHELHEVKNLDGDESLRLFSLRAFGSDKPETRYKDQSIKLVKHCGGIPLALVVLGSSLNGRGLWEYELASDKMESIPQTRQLVSLKVCLDSLPDGRRTKDLFLYIVFFFLGKDKDYVMTILEKCGLYAETGIRTLANRCFLTVDRDNKLQMHHLLQDMGIKIIQEEKLAGECQRLRQHEDALDVLSSEKNRQYTEAIEALILDFPVAKEPFIYETDAFSRMEKLRILHLNNVQLTGGYERFPARLVWLRWDSFPLSSLPTDFLMEKLVVLDMRYSKLKQVWDKPKFLPSLKILNLSHSHDLTCTPDFSGLYNLESLILKDCVNLLDVQSIVQLKRLVQLNLKRCINLRKLPTEILHPKVLKKLVLSSYSLHLIQPEAPVELESLTELYPQLHISD